MSDAQNVKVIGRIVWIVGKTPFLPRQKTVFGTNQPKLNKNGQQEIEYGFGLAVPKDQFGVGGAGIELWTAMHQAAAALYQGRPVPPIFAYKYKDGDAVDATTGRANSDKTGFAGNLVFAMTTQLPIKFFKNVGHLEMVNDGIKCGDWVQVSLQVKGQNSAKPGLYLNPNAVLFLQAGEEIINAPSGNDIFGTAPVAVPSFIPAAPQGAPVGVPTFAQQMPQAVAPSYAAPAPQMAPPPHYGILPQAHQPQMMPQPVAAPFPQNQQVYQQPVAPMGMPQIPGVPQ